MPRRDARYDCYKIRKQYGHEYKEKERYYSDLKYVFPCPHCKQDVMTKPNVKTETGYYDEVSFLLDIDMVCPHCEIPIVCTIPIY